VISLTQVILSTAQKNGDAERRCTDEEPQHRTIGEDPDSNLRNWSDGEAEDGTACLAGRTRKGWPGQKTELKLVNDQLIAKNEK
jgi:hypothetical protein